ncbi:MAG: winged helix-turn-helix transcriptional regulator, partial [Cetobacterium sp.]
MKNYHCPFEVLIEIVSGKWKMLILWQLNVYGHKRFSDLKKIAEGVSTKVITSQLRDLEKQGMIKRVVYPEVPPKVEYHITELGKSLWPVLLSMQEWSIDYLEKSGVKIEQYILDELNKIKIKNSQS